MRSCFYLAILGSVVASCLGSCGGTVETSADNLGGAAGQGGQAHGGKGGTLDAGKGGQAAGSAGTLVIDASGVDSADAHPACVGPNPAGCFQNGIGCPNGQQCAHTGCASSQCECVGGIWGCNADCSGGTCVPIDASTPKSCGGMSGAKCSPAEWCDYEYLGPNYCGGDDGSGTCKTRPSGCPENCPGTCGCDGTYYCNDCLAHAAGVDDGSMSPCSPLVDGGQLDCDSAMKAVSAQMTAPSCTAVVRLSYNTKTLLGWQFVCGPVSKIDEVKARAVAQLDTGLGGGTWLNSLSGPNPADEYVFFANTWDFGSVAAVSATSGLSVFGGTVIWSGHGDITWPMTPWNAPNALGGQDCAIQFFPSWRGFDLSDGQSGYNDAAALSALTAVWQTALPAGIFQVQPIKDVVVLLYARMVGGFDPVSAEWIVLVNSQAN